jgi:hypothetical protein
MVGDYQSASFAGGRAHPVFAIAKPPAGATFDERAASASFDVTVDLGVSRTRPDKVRYRPHNRPEDPFYPSTR